MPYTRYRYLVATLMSIGLSGTMALAQTTGATSYMERSDSSHAERLDKAFRNLNLSEDQKLQLQVLRENHRAATQDLRTQIRDAQTTIASTPRNDPNYDSVTAQARQTLMDARSQLQTQNQIFQTNARAVLTPDQLNALETGRFERQQRMSEKRAQRMERRSQRRDQRPRHSDR
jgi:hypothetical protein